MGQICQICSNNNQLNANKLENTYLLFRWTLQIVDLTRFSKSDCGSEQPFSLYIEGLTKTKGADPNLKIYRLPPCYKKNLTLRRSIRFR